MFRYLIYMRKNLPHLGFTFNILFESINRFQDFTQHGMFNVRLTNGAQREAKGNARTTPTFLQNSFATMEMEYMTTFQL